MRCQYWAPHTECVAREAARVALQAAQADSGADVRSYRRRGRRSSLFLCAFLWLVIRGSRSALEGCVEAGQLVGSGNEIQKRVDVQRNSNWVESAEDCFPGST